MDIRDLQKLLEETDDKLSIFADVELFSKSNLTVKSLLDLFVKATDWEYKKR